MPVPMHVHRRSVESGEKTPFKERYNTERQKKPYILKILQILSLHLYFIREEILILRALPKQNYGKGEPS
jgi:hypothetical protein